MTNKSPNSVCYSYIPDRSLCCNGMVRCCGIINCMRKYPSLQYSYYEVHGMTWTKEQKEHYRNLFKEATGITLEEYHTKEYWGKRFVKRRDGTIEVNE